MNARIQTPVAILAAVGFIFLSEVAVADASPALDRALKELRESDADWRRERDNYRRQRDSGAIDGVEAAEYAEFVAGLQRRKFENCENVRRIGGDAALEGTDCVVPGAAGGGQVQQASLPEPAATDAEKLDSLEQKLKSLEAALDEQLSHAQQANREKAGRREARLPSANAGPRSGGVSSDAGKRDGTGADAPKWSDPGAEKKNGAGSPPEGTATGGAAETDNAARTPPDGKHRDPGAGTDGEEKAASTPVSKDGGEDGTDDDVVLRQVREAAEKETDPVLKEKLWEEYRKMKAARK